MHKKAKTSTRACCQTGLALTGITMLGCVMSQAADAVSLYSVTDLGSLTRQTYSYANSINNLGQVVVNAGFNDSRAFLYSDDQLIEISPISGDNAIAVTDLNNSGQVVGNSVNENNFAGNNPLLYSNGTTQSIGIQDAIPYAINDSGQVVGGTSGGGVFPSGAAFLYSSGTTTIINTGPSNTGAVAYDINNSGQVVGIQSFGRAFLYDNGTTTDLGTLLGDTYSSAEGINNQGQVVGVSAPTGVNDGTAFLYSSTGMTSLGRLLKSDTYSVALDINNLGQVVGFSGSNNNFFSESGNDIRAFLYSDGMMQDLNKLIIPGSGFTLTQARAINDQGEIVGAGSINGELHAVLLTPQSSQEVPEPASALGIFAFGAFGAGSRVWRKHKPASLDKSSV